MISNNAQRQHTPPGAGTSKPLKRGKACLTCRFLKIRCDGTRPICGPCQRTPKDDPCEYADGPGRSRTRTLEETVSRLEARLREYEHPEETPPMALHNPYEHGQSHESGTSIQIKIDAPSSSYSTHSSPSSPFSVMSPSANIPSPHPGGSSGSSDRKNSASPATEPGIALPATRHLPCRGLLSTVYLWGIHLSPQTQHKDLEHTLLMRALRDTASDLSTSDPHPHRFMHTIQAETLLGYYFFRNGNILEAKRHTSSAASLALGCRLNILRSSQQQQWSSNPILASAPVVLGGSINLPPPQDPIEEGERINAFWAVFTLYRDVAVAVDPPRSVCGVFDAPGCQIDTPWPLDMDMYKKNILPPRSSSTVYEFLNHIQQREDEHQLASTTNMITKASLLLHQASFVAGQYYPNMPARDAQTLFAAFQSVQYLINSLRSQLSPLEELDRQSRNLSALREIHLAHSLIHGSIIRLNETFSHSDADCRQSCIKSAQAMVHGGGLNVAEFGCVNPIMGILWALACQTLIREVVRIRSIPSGQTPELWSSSSQSSDPSSISPSHDHHQHHFFPPTRHFGPHVLLCQQCSYEVSTHERSRSLFCDWVMNIRNFEEGVILEAKDTTDTGDESIIGSKSCAWRIADHYHYSDLSGSVSNLGPKQSCEPCMKDAILVPLISTLQASKQDDGREPDYKYTPPTTPGLFSILILSGTPD
ncbi:Zn -Cys binuclear cluster domain-containing protein [Lentinula edodes]|uniref:Zn-Cys binuclear cluster domain-containing protein n=1 Tax=Lentinula edodes TaxID=5353 RepID=A0A1Q3EK32_LENED|nr:Zn -Cys binuclear cluster domain-containing protein [Lentinula edodes]